MLNWRDPGHPKAGGAELVTLRILENLAASGRWDISWFSGAYPSGAAEERINGIHFIRAGSALSVRWEALRRYGGNNNFDIVVDQTNTLPFFTPLYSKVPVILFMHQVAKEVWWYEAPPVLGLIGYLAEPVMLAAYRNLPFITVSKSSALSMRNIGLRGPAFIIPEAVDEVADDDILETKSDSDILVMGRVSPSKRIEESIRAIALLKELNWNGLLFIAGAGERSYLQKLKRLADSLGVTDRIIFCGRIDTITRRNLMQRARVLWMTSVREGWGLVVSEAARHFVPAVVYDVPGLRDSVIDGSTGFVVECKPLALAHATAKLFENRDGWRKLAISAHEFSCRLSWAATADAFERALLTTIAACQRS